jgi:hypothetical protein
MALFSREGQRKPSMLSGQRAEHVICLAVDEKLF